MSHIWRDLSSGHGAVAVDVSAADQTLAPGCRGLYVGTTGNIVVDLIDSSSITFTNVPAGIFPVQATKVYKTGTTASGVVALY